jgi:hypothetical protein
VLSCLYLFANFDFAYIYDIIKMLSEIKQFAYAGMYMRKLSAIGIVLLFSSCLHAGDIGIRTSSLEDENAIIASNCPAGSYTALNSEHFRIVHQAKTGDIEKIASLLDLAYERFHGVFSNIGFAVDTPKEKLTWICFDDSSRFKKYTLKADKADLSWLSSYYSTKTNIVAIVKSGKITNLSRHSLSRTHESGGDILAINMAPDSQNEADTVRFTHEAAHQLAFNTGLQKRGIMYPFWVSEGLATMFETALSDSCDKIRGGRLVEMRKHERLCKLSEFVTITSPPADAELQKDFYAQAWGLFEFLSKYHKNDLVKYFAGLYSQKQGPRGKAALYGEFVASFGPIEKLEKSWQDFIAGLSTAQ